MLTFIHDLNNVSSLSLGLFILHWRAPNSLVCELYKCLNTGSSLGYIGPIGNLNAASPAPAMVPISLISKIQGLISHGLVARRFFFLLVPSVQLHMARIDAVQLQGRALL